MISIKQKYRAHCKTESSIPIFSKNWWLDAVCGKDNWNVVVVEKGGQIIASMPHFMVKRRGMRRTITMPKLTQTMGPWMRPSSAKYANQIAEQKDLMTALIQKLPLFAYFFQMAPFLLAGIQSDYQIYLCVGRDKRYLKNMGWHVAKDTHRYQKSAKSIRSSSMHRFRNRCFFDYE